MKKAFSIILTFAFVLTSFASVITYADSTNYAVGDNFKLFARDLYDNAGKNDPYGQTQGFDSNGILDPVGQDRFNGGTWSTICFRRWYKTFYLLPQRI